MKVKFIEEINKNYVEYEALEDGVIITSCGDHPSFTKEAKDMSIFIKKHQRFQLSKPYILKNSLKIEKGSSKSEAKE